MDKYFTKKKKGSASSEKAAAKKPSSNTSSKKSFDVSFLVGVRAYYTETLDDPYIEGLELLYSDGTSLRCGKCSLVRMSDVMPFAKDEHIIGVDFRNGGGKEKLIELCLYTSHPEGRVVSFYIQCDGDDKAVEQYADGDRELFVGVHDDIVSEVGKEFTCKRGKRVTGINFQGGKITNMIQDIIPKGHNEEWWKKSLGYEPNEKLRLAAEKAKDHLHLVSIRASFIEKDGGNNIAGLELRYSRGPPVHWGKIQKKMMSAAVSFEKDEHIVGIDFNASEDDGITSLDLYTSNFEGRIISFSFSFCGGINTYEDYGCYIGVYGHAHSLSPKGETYTCKHGQRVSGITFKNDAIIGMSQETIPKGQNEKWFEDCCDYDSDRDPGKMEKKLCSRAKWQMEVEKAKHVAMMKKQDERTKIVMAKHLAMTKKKDDKAKIVAFLKKVGETSMNRTQDSDEDSDSESDSESKSDSDTPLCYLGENDPYKRRLKRLEERRKERKKLKRSGSNLEKSEAMYRRIMNNTAKNPVRDPYCFGSDKSRNSDEDSDSESDSDEESDSDNALSDVGDNARKECKDSECSDSDSGSENDLAMYRRIMNGTAENPFRGPYGFRSSFSRYMEGMSRNNSPHGGPR